MGLHVSVASAEQNADELTWIGSACSLILADAARIDSNEVMSISTVLMLGLRLDTPSRA